MTEKKFDVVVVGEINPDLILSGDVVPEFGQVEKMVDQATLAIGSSSAIFACGAARLGLRVAIVGKVGKDIFGAFMRDSMAAEGIDVGGIVEDTGHQTGISVILTKGNDRAILTFDGTIPLMTTAEIDLDIVSQSRHLHVGGYYLQKALQPGLPDLFNTAHRKGLSTSIDTNYDPAGQWDSGIKELIEKADILLPNETECCGIAGTADLDKAIEILRRKVNYLAVKRGEEGALLCWEGKTIRGEPLKVNLVDTVGAGDSFDAGFIYGYLSGWQPARMLALANACGGLSTQRAGGTTAQPTLDEALRTINTDREE